MIIESVGAIINRPKNCHYMFYKRANDIRPYGVVIFQSTPMQQKSTMEKSIVLLWRAWQDSPVCGRSGGAEKPAPGSLFNTRPSNPTSLMMQKTPRTKVLGVLWRAWQDSNLRPTGS